MKYYTPTIDDFHVGFECEMKNSSDPIYFDWEHCTFKDDFSNELSEDYCFEYLRTDLKEENIRVKYLDRDDIESCSFNTEDNGECYNKTNAFDIYGLYPWEWDKGIQNQYKIILNGDTLFLGIIKNKSELKVLLKQLNIDE